MIARERRSSLLLLRLEHGKASALDVELLEALERELDGIGDARAVVITGTGNIFSAGVDLFRLVEAGPDYVQRFFPLLVSVFRKLFLLPLPVVAACNGHAIAGGALMVCAADHRLMTDGKGRIGVPELLVGVPFPALALEMLRFATGARAQQVALSGTTFFPADALSVGLVDDVVPSDVLLDRAMEHAERLAAIPRDAFRLTKMQLRKPYVDAAERLSVADAEALAIWSDPASHTHIREYLAKTVRK